jgi:hypothetical protein
MNGCMSSLYYDDLAGGGDAAGVESPVVGGAGVLATALAVLI